MRNCCFTIFKFDNKELVSMDTKWDKLPEGTKYMVWQLEISPETGKAHIQGYAEFDSPYRMNRIKEILESSSAHIEKRKGSRDQARNYCMKKESRIIGPWELGIFETGKQGARNDLKEISDAIKQGANFKECFEINPGACLRYPKGIDRAINVFEKKQMIEKKVTVLWGPTGTGKTHKAWAEAGMEAWSKPRGSWFDGYEGQENVIIDEYDGDIPITTFLQILDKYPIQVPIKGGFRSWKAKNIWITSNINWKLWYPEANEKHIQALERRLHSINELTQKFGEKPVV